METNIEAHLCGDDRSDRLRQDDAAYSGAPNGRAMIRSDNAILGIARVGTIDAIKAISSQLIVLHHFCLYGPMTDAAWSYAPWVFKWLANDARLAVQCFLVTAGFLAAGVLLPAGTKSWSPPTMASLPGIVSQRYLRLAKVYFVGLGAAIACAAFARALIQDPSTPTAPTWTSFAAHILFAQDLLGIPALTAGAWYIAIDFQLYTMLALICAASAFAARGSLSARFIAMSAVAVLGLCSLLIFNRNNGLEAWGIYFFGSYSLGMAARWASQARGARKWAGLAAMALACALALAVQWRSRIAVSTMTAFVLATVGARRSAGYGLPAMTMAFLSRLSFPLFVLHYPALMLIGSVVKAGWGNDPLPSAIGLGVAWLLSMVAAYALSSWLDRTGKRHTATTNAQAVI